MLSNISAMSENDIEKKLEQIMESAYSKLDDNSFITRWENKNITNQEKVMMILGNFNYQVNNGGISQWIYNEYAGCEDLYPNLFRFGINNKKFNNIFPCFRVLGALVDKHSKYNIELATTIYNICKIISDLPSEYYENGLDIVEEYFEEEDENGNIVEYSEEYEVEVEPENLENLFNNYDNQYYKFKEEDVFKFFAYILKDEENGNILSDEYLNYNFNKISLERDISEEYIQKIAEKTGIRYPQVKVNLLGKDGNAFAILGKVQEAMKKAKIPREEISKFMDEAKSGDYNNLLITVIKYVNCDNAINLDEKFKEIIEEENKITYKI